MSASGMGGATELVDGGAATGGALVGAAGANDQVAGAAGTPGACVEEPAPAKNGGTCGAELQTDPRNCGACGIDCLGGWCDQGTCKTLTELAGGLTEPDGLAVAGSTLYVSEYGSATLLDGSLQKLSTSCPTGLEPISTNVQTPYGLVVDGPTVYWLNDGKNGFGNALMSAPTQGGTPTPLATGLDRPGYQIALDATYAYFPIQGVAPNYQTGGAVYRCARTGCGTTPTLLASGGAFRPGGLALSTTHLYWSLQGTYPDVADGSLLRCQPADCAGTTETLVTTVKLSRGLAFSAGVLYWLEGGTSPNFLDGSVKRCDPTNCVGTAVTVLSNLDMPFRLAVDSTHAYVTELQGAHGVVRAPLGGGAEQRVATTTTGAYGLALDADFVYFSEAGQASDGRVWRVRK